MALLAQPKIAQTRLALEPLLPPARCSSLARTRGGPLDLSLDGEVLDLRNRMPNWARTGLWGAWRQRPGLPDGVLFLAFSGEKFVFFAARALVAM